MKNTLLVILFYSVQGLYAQSFNSNLASLLQQTLDSALILFPNTIGMSASVYYPNQGVWNGVSGVSYTGQAISSNMKFGIASNSKLFTSVVLLKLAENNQLSLDDAIGQWLPPYNNVSPNITIRQLLNHTSGLSDPFFTTALLDSIKATPTHYYTPNEVLSWLGAPAFNTPGTSYAYSNTNYLLAGMIAESATGIPIHQLIRNEILTPLQLNEVFYDVQETEINPIAHRWEDNGIDLHNTSRISVNTAVGAAGSLFSTSGDVVHWYHALMDGGVINQNSLNELSTFASPGNYGLGIGLFHFFGHTCWGHGGSTIGYTSRTIYDPCMRAAVCGLSNSSLSAVDGITAKLYKVLVDYLPACAASISGASSVCQSQNNVSYTVPAIAHATNYSWTLPNGATGNSSTNSIVVHYGAGAVSGNITVKGSNTYGDGASSSLHINVQPQPIIVGNINGCVGSWQSYSIVATGGAGTTYVWNIVNGSIASGCGLNDTYCNVWWNSAGNGSISVSQTNP